MKTIGLIGGMSWESTTNYYRLINTLVKQQLGGLHSAKIALYSVDFAEIELLQQQGNWQQAAQYLTEVALNIEKAGADFLVICTNTMHIVAEQIQQNIKIPLIHIADATGEALIAKNIKTVGLLGTAFTMEKDFYKGRLADKYGLTVITPNEHERQQVHQIIFHELCVGSIKPESKQTYLTIIDKLVKEGAEAIILGCTEIGMLIKQQDTQIPLFDTTSIHAEKAVKLALS
ncbi:aspartate/glutamate racemase family protein [Entomomonas asaccharolytica]|uniref:Aspartate/glutamate racemase family protein n=1 Tax=Entomomonas asaccharolytica TaxID=2785331 RepID=A0A974NFK3_9GAMM|nr:aspartate/glutamate racemase family protein [Entomomonas asaccharolytica]QQP85572.1 aspartate/glutamate racemase family protein [Entomomonas asaccharolytica]